MELYSQIDLLVKFGTYFKREAKELIAKMMGDRFNLKKERGDVFFKTNDSLTLSNKNRKIKKFLKKVFPLSSQEIRCLELFKEGHSAQATAAILNLSPRTVESYFESIKYKLSCSSKAELLEI
ncbi:MAG: hypothetical protein K940chlam9_01791 [Chlamydiae bacterium]|nr:hypothetical protein [Chlamydiota bacterium]